MTSPVMRGSPLEFTPMRLSDMRISIPREKSKINTTKKVRLDTHVIERHAHFNTKEKKQKTKKLDLTPMRLSDMRSSRPDTNSQTQVP